MGMGLVNESEFESQLNNTVKDTPIQKSEDKVIEGQVIEVERPGRKEGDNNVPTSLRNLIGVTANVEGRKEALTLAKLMGVSPSSASAYAKGASSTSSYTKPSGNIKEVIAKGKSRATKKALNVLNKSVAGITDDKLESLNARELAGVAKDMAAVVRHMDPEPDSNRGPLVQFQLYAPQLTSEDSYERIQVSE